MIPPIACCSVAGGSFLCKKVRKALKFLQKGVAKSFGICYTVRRLRTCALRFLVLLKQWITAKANREVPLNPERAVQKQG